MIMLDTHIVVWMLNGDFGPQTRRLLERRRPWLVSPIVLLELEILSESKSKVRHIDVLSKRICQDSRLVVHDASLALVADAAQHLTWTRDPFDRLLVAHSIVAGAPFCTDDSVIVKYHQNLCTIS